MRVVEPHFVVVILIETKKFELIVLASTAPLSEKYSLINIQLSSRSSTHILYETPHTFNHLYRRSRANVKRLL